MNENTELWREWKKIKNEAREKRRLAAPEILKQLHIAFTEKNYGAHLILETRLGLVDFWPGTTRWAIRNLKGTNGYGLVRLLQIIQNEIPGE